MTSGEYRKLLTPFNIALLVVLMLLSFFFAVRKFRRQDIVAQFGNVRIQVGAFFGTAARGQ